MEIYLVRHGIAAEKGIYAQDAERPLTEKGITKTTKVAQHLFSLGVSFEAILSSPLIRAYQTAEILKKVGLGKQITTDNFLAPDGDIQLWLQWLSDNYDDTHKIALVGHQPDLGNWAEMLVIGKIKEQLVLKKAGIIGIKITDKMKPIGKSELFLLTSPKWFI
jgi:phosphohistidine phosphatase